MSERQLVTCETIANISPIEGADAIETARIRGWNVVVKKGEFTVGDPVLYFEVDSAMPMSDDRFAFLANRGAKTITGEDGIDRSVHVLKTARLRGVYSQGLAMPLGQFPEVTAALGGPGGTVGAPTAVTGVRLEEILGVSKWDPPLPAGAHALGPFPGFVSKTDAERVQNITPSTWAQIIADRSAWSAVEKVDGNSFTAWVDHDGVLHVAARTWELDPTHDNHFWVGARRHQLREQLAPGQWLQAEVAGPGIQKNPLGLDQVRLFAFGFGHIDDGYGARAHRDQWPTWVNDIAAPVYDYTLPETVEEAISQVRELKSLITPGRGAEGVVWTRPDGRGLDGLDGRPVFKSISDKYLLKHS